MADRIIRKQVRLTPEESETLEHLAEAQGTTESDILREGLEIKARLQRRHDAIEGLIRLAEEVPGDPRDSKWSLR